MKRAAIYVRVSTEGQAEKVSPRAQEADARALCESKGYEVVDVYRDTEPYRVGRRMMQPSGTRADRPQLRRMLADAEAGKFAVIVAWREDRLYRSVRPMLDVIETTDRAKVDIELVKETFDRQLALVKVWVASMELQARRDRMEMGVKGRLAAGRGWWPRPAYGYQYDPTNGITVNENEAQWVRAIFAWYVEGLRLKDIRKRLIEAGAAERGEKVFTWSTAIISHYLRQTYYYTGNFITKIGDETFETPVPVIIDPDIAAAADQRREAWKKRPVGNEKVQSLAGGIATCAKCGHKLRVVRMGNYEYYRCARGLKHTGVTYEGCGRNLQIRKIDSVIWGKLWAIISQPGVLQAALDARIAALRAEDVDRAADTHKAEAALEELDIERQKVITWARKSLISESDMETQLLALSFQEAELKRQLSQARLLAANTDRLAAMAQQFQERLADGLQGLNDAPADEEEAQRQFEDRRRIVHQLVENVTVSEKSEVVLYLLFEIGETLAPDLYIPSNLDNYHLRDTQKLTVQLTV